MATTAKPCNYALEIYEPNTIQTVAKTFSSSSPFMAYREGDLLDPRTWADSGHAGSLLVVVKVIHWIWENEDEVRHKIGVYTRLAPHTEEIMLGDSPLFSRTERLMLSNQYRILEALYPDEKDSFEAAREAVEHGYEMHYDWISEHIYKEDACLSETQCKEVLEVLSMFDMIQVAYDRLKDKTDIDEHRTEFLGFDGNDKLEGRYGSYAAYFCGLDGGRYKTLRRTPDFNSHMPILPLYRMMLREWEKSKDKIHLTHDDLVRITGVSLR